MDGWRNKGETMTSFRQVAMSMGLSPADSEDDLEIELMISGSLGGGEPGASHITGTRALMLAVLEDAIRCYLDGGKTSVEESQSWIFSNWRGWPFAFVVVCETLGLDPSAVRKTLRKMKQARIRSREAIPRARKNVRVPGRVCLRKSRRLGAVDR